MNKQYAYGPWKPVKDFVQTKQNIQVKFGNMQTRAPAGILVQYLTCMMVCFIVKCMSSIHHGLSILVSNLKSPVLTREISNYILMMV